MNVQVKEEMCVKLEVTDYEPPVYKTRDAYDPHNDDDHYKIKQENFQDSVSEDEIPTIIPEFVDVRSFHQKLNIAVIKNEDFNIKLTERNDIKDEISVSAPQLLETTLNDQVHKESFTKKPKSYPPKRNYSGKRLTECEICKKKFLCNSDLQRHIISHTGEKPFQCDVCQKNFTQKSHLKIHVLIHAKEKKFECEVCNNKFLRKCHLQAHKMVHAKEDPLECQICKVKFTQKCFLKSHMVNHAGEKNFECNVCKKKFLFKWLMQRHATIHTGDKPFQCEVCTKRFLRRSHLKDHTKIHTGEKQFECETCKKKFSRRSHIQRHVNSCRRKNVLVHYIKKEVYPT